MSLQLSFFQQRLVDFFASLVNYSNITRLAKEVLIINLFAVRHKTLTKHLDIFSKYHLFLHNIVQSTGDFINIYTLLFLTLLKFCLDTFVIRYKFYLAIDLFQDKGNIADNDCPQGIEMFFMLFNFFQ